MVDILQFNKNKPLQAREGNALVPAGWYSVELTKTEMTTPSNGKAARLSAIFNVLERVVGPGENGLEEDPSTHAGASIFTGFNVCHEKDDVRNRAFRDLESLAFAAGIEGDFTDTAQLHRIPLMAKVTVKEADGQYPASNSIGSFRKLATHSAPAANWSASAPAVTLAAPAIDFGAAAQSAPAPVAAPVEAEEETEETEEEEDEERAAIVAESAPALPPLPPGWHYENGVPTQDAAPVAAPKKPRAKKEAPAPAPVATPVAEGEKGKAPWEM